MKNKGFTLVEVLAAIIILGIVAIIAIPKIQQSLYESQNGSYNYLVSRLESLAEDYITYKRLESSITATSPVIVYIYQLVDEGFVEESDLEDPRTDGYYIDAYNSFVKFKLENGVIKYEPHFTVHDPKE